MNVGSLKPGDVMFRPLDSGCYTTVICIDRINFVWSYAIGLFPTIAKAIIGYYTASEHELYRQGFSGGRCCHSLIQDISGYKVTSIPLSETHKRALETHWKGL